MNDGGAAPNSAKSSVTDGATPSASSAVSTRAATGAVLLAFAWAFAEASFFFIVPDVFLTRVALTDLRRALRLGVVAMAGALLGGTLIWWMANHGGAVQLFRVFGWLPGINDLLIWTVGREVMDHGASALFVGALKGQPFKLFVVSGSILKVPLGQFLAYAALARLGRFWMTSALAAACGHLLQRKSARVRHQLHVLFWIGFYALYFAGMR